MAKIEFYESIETAPYRNYQKFNKYLALANEVGENPQDWYKRIDRATKYVAAGDKATAVKELSNLKLSVAHAAQEFSPQGFALAAMVKSVDGVLVTDLSAESLTKVLEAMSDSGYSLQSLRAKILDLKKKLIHKLKYILQRLRAAALIIM